MKKPLWYYKNSSFEAFNVFGQKGVQDTIWRLIAPFVTSQKAPKSRLSAVLGRPGRVSKAFLRRLWRRRVVLGGRQAAREPSRAAPGGRQAARGAAGAGP